MIIVRDVSHIFGIGGASHSLVVLDKLSFEINRGEFVALVGPTGCGKTTLLRIIAGLIRPTAGSVWVNGRELDGPDRQIGLVFQRPTLLPWRTVKQNLALPAELIGMSVAGLSNYINELLRYAGLENFRDSFPHELSIGMQQIVSFCMALVPDPKVILMDEPFSALDSISREVIGQQMMDFCSEANKTVLLVTHSVQEAVHLSDRVIVLSPKPTHIVDTVEVHVPRPRSLSFLQTADFWSISSEVRKALASAKG